MKATWNDQIIAESDDIVEIEGNAYFPADSIQQQYFQPSNTHTDCPWKGMAYYYTVNVNGIENKDAAWYYPEPTEKARMIKDRVAFWKGIQVSE